MNGTSFRITASGKRLRSRILQFAMRTAPITPTVVPIARPMPAPPTRSPGLRAEAVGSPGSPSSSRSTPSTVLGPQQVPQAIRVAHELDGRLHLLVAWTRKRDRNDLANLPGARREDDDPVGEHD